MTEEMKTLLLVTGLSFIFFTIIIYRILEFKEPYSNNMHGYSKEVKSSPSQISKNSSYFVDVLISC